MPRGFSSLPTELYIAIVTAAWVAWIVLNIPNYSKMYYEDTKKVSKSAGNYYIGYPADESVDVLSSYDDIKNTHNCFVIEAYPDELIPTGIYKSLVRDKYYTNRFSKIFNGNADYGVGQFYVVQLDDGKNVLVFIDYKSVSLSGNEKIKLPISKVKEINNSKISKKLSEKYDIEKDEMNIYIDAAGDWRKGKEGEASLSFAWKMAGITFVVIAVLLYILFKFILLKEKENKNIIDNMVYKRKPLK